MLLLDPYIREFVSPSGHSDHRTFIDLRPNTHSHLWLAMPLPLFQVLTARRASAVSRLYRASDPTRFQMAPVGALRKAFQGVTPSFHLSRYQLLLPFLRKPRNFSAAWLLIRAAYRARRSVCMRTCRTDPEIFAGFAFALGVCDQAGDQLQDVFFTVNVRKGVIVLRLGKVNGIEDFDAIAFLLKELAAFQQHGSLRVGYHI